MKLGYLKILHLNGGHTDLYNPLIAGAMHYIIHNHQQICSHLYLSSGKTTPCLLTTSCLQLVPTTLVCWWVCCGDRQPRVEVCPVGAVETQLPIITAEFRGTAQLIDFTGIYPGMPLQVFKSAFDLELCLELNVRWVFTCWIGDSTLTTSWKPQSWLHLLTRERIADKNTIITG